MGLVAAGNFKLCSSRTYQVGWAEDPGRESTLEFRLTIDNAREGDTGAYTCITPSKHSHRIDIVVKSEFFPFENET